MRKDLVWLVAGVLFFGLLYLLNWGVKVISTDLLVWIGAFLTIAILSFLYQDNPFYKFAEHLFVGVSAAYWMCMGFWNTLVPNLIAKLHPPIVKGVLPAIAEKPPEYWYIIPAILGIMFLMRLSPKAPWISRWALAFIVGTTTGLNLVRYLRSDFVGQIENTLIPVIVVENGSLTLGGSFSNIVVVLGVLCGLIYFFFSKEHRGIFGVASRVGIYILMITFGASFGYTVMARISLLVGRMQFLFGDWMGLIQ
jgi:hypothetical protein